MDLTKVKLTKTWGSRSAGTVVEVDAVRLAALRQGGFVDGPTEDHEPAAAELRSGAKERDEAHEKRKGGR